MRQIIVVDCESTGLHDDAAILELAAINLATGEEMRIVPRVSPEAFAKAQPEAFHVNRYFEREVFRDILCDGYAEVALLRDLGDWLRDNILAGSNPAFDAKLLANFEWRHSMSPGRRFGARWHHRLLDLSAYAAGVLGLPPRELPGLHKVCELLGVTNEGEHTALGDARATAECFRRLMAMGGMSDRTRVDLLGDYLEGLDERL